MRDTLRPARYTHETMPHQEPRFLFHHRALPWVSAGALFLVLNFVSGTAHAQPDDLDDLDDAGDDMIDRDERVASEDEPLRPFPVVKTGSQAGFRTGFAMGMGKFATHLGELSDNSRGFIPFWLDLGYRVHPHVYVGAYGQYGYLLLRKGGMCEGEYTQCSGQNYRVGGNVHYHFTPDGSVDPWIGLGAGYEWYRNSIAYSESGIPNRSFMFKGFELINLQLGLDIKNTRQGGVGPFLALAVGQYAAQSRRGLFVGDATEETEKIVATEMHQWVFFGIQGSYFEKF